MFVDRPLVLAPVIGEMASISNLPKPSTLSSDAKAGVLHVENIDLPAKQPRSQDEFKDIETVALVVKEPKADFELTPVILDEVRGDEVLIDMKYSGICQ